MIPLILILYTGIGVGVYYELGESRGHAWWSAIFWPALLLVSIGQRIARM